MRVAERVGVDPRTLIHLQSFEGWRGRGEFGWEESEVGYQNVMNECYMIALVQMLGTARRLRDAIGQLPVPVVGDAAHSSRVTNVLRMISF